MFLFTVYWYMCRLGVFSVEQSLFCLGKVNVVKQDGLYNIKAIERRKCIQHVESIEKAILGHRHYDGWAFRT